MTTIAPAPIISRDAIDTAITVTFRPCDPLGLTEVAIDGEPDGHDMLILLDAAIERLGAYRTDYMEAMAADGEWAEDEHPCFEAAVARLYDDLWPSA